MDPGLSESTHLVEKGKSLLTHIGETVSTRAKFILPNLIRSSLLITLGTIFTIFAIAWFSVLAWGELRLTFASDRTAFVILGGGFLTAGLLCFIVGRRSGAAALEAPHSVQGKEGESRVRSELAALSEDVGKMAKQALDPIQIVQANAGKIILVTTLIGVMVGMRVKEPKKRRK